MNCVAPLREGELKQAIQRVYNRVNQQLFGFGVLWQRVEVLPPRVVVVLAANRRAPVLSVLSHRDPVAVALMDSALVREYKAQLRQGLEEELGVPVQAVFKDYDPASEMAATVILFSQDLPVAASRK